MTLAELKEKVSSIDDIYELLRNARNSKKVWTHRGSSTSTFLANPLHYAIQQGLGLDFQGNEKTLFGSSVHEAIDYAYKQPTHRVGLAIRSLIEKALCIYNGMTLEVQNTFDIADTIKEAIKAFKLYKKEVIPFNRMVASEQFMELMVPLDFLKNPLNEGKIKLAGTLDRVYEVDGVYELGDTKTSSSKISAKVEKSEELIKWEYKKGALVKQIEGYEKTIKKFVNAEVKINEFGKQLVENKAALEDSKANGKATKAIENKIDKLYRDIATWEENLEDKQIATNAISIIKKDIEKQEEKFKPLLEEYQALKKEADLKECIKRHNLQVAFYAILYMILYGIEIKKAKIEVIVRTKKGPEIQIFEWDLDDEALDKANSALQMVIQTIEAYFDGVEPSLLFRPNPFTFYGTETNDLLESLIA